MDIRMTPSVLSGTVQAVSSKSDVHRALICAALSDQDTVLSVNLMSKDIEATIRCLQAAGAEIRVDKDSETITVSPIPSSVKTCFKEEESSFSPAPCLDCGESGSTLRFLLPVMAALGIPAVFHGAGELPNRPLTALLEALSEHGIRFSAERLPLTIAGKLSGGAVRIAGNISSQYITGFLLAAPLLEEDIEIVLSTALESSAYVDMTIDTMARFGVTVEKTKTGFFVGKECRYHSPSFYASDGDWSNSAFWLCAAAIHHSGIRVNGLREDSVQGDKAIIGLIDRFLSAFPVFNCARDRVMEKQSAGGHLILSASGIPDLVPILAVLAAYADGETQITHAERLRLKECDRLRAMREVLSALGAEVTELPDGLVIRGHGGLAGGVPLDGHRDHRIVMAAAIAASACRDPVIIRGAEAVTKSYPHFFEDYRKLGGIADVVDLR